VVVGDDQVHAAVAGDLGLLDGGDAAVDRDDQLRALVAQLGQRLGVQAVAFLDAVGDVELGVPAEHADRVPQDAGGRDAVDVVVAVDDDLLLVPDRPGDPVGGLGDAGQGVRVVQGRQRRAEERLAVGRLGDAPAEQDLGDQRGDLQAARQLVGGRVRRGDVPALRSVHRAVSAVIATPQIHAAGHRRG
jgi:hypothetical protein